MSRGGVPFVPGTVPVCPGHRPAQNVYVYWFFPCPNNMRPAWRTDSLPSWHKSILFVYGTTNQPEFFLPKFFLHPPGIMDVRVFGSWMSTPKCLFFQGLEGLPQVFDPGRPRECPRDVRGISSPKTLSLGCFFVPDCNEMITYLIPNK